MTTSQFASSPLFCPLEVEWGAVADWAIVGISLLAAAATVWAVIVSLGSSKRALQLSRELRKDERDEADSLRKLRAKAYAAVVVDSLADAKGSIDSAIDWYENEQIDDSLRKCTQAHAFLVKVDSSVLFQALAQADSFPEHLGKPLARLAVMLAGVKTRAESQQEFLRSHPGAFMLVREEVLALRHKGQLMRDIAQDFYDVAEIDEASRFLKPVAAEEKQALDALRKQLFPDGGIPQDQ